MEKEIEFGYAKLRLGGKEIEVPMRTETVKHDDGRQDVAIHLPSLSTIIAGTEDGKRNL